MRRSWGVDGRKGPYHQNIWLLALPLPLSACAALGRLHLLSDSVSMSMKWDSHTYHLALLGGLNACGLIQGEQDGCP